MSAVTQCANSAICRVLLGIVSRTSVNFVQLAAVTVALNEGGDPAGRRRQVRRYQDVGRGFRDGIRCSCMLTIQSISDVRLGPFWFLGKHCMLDSEHVGRSD